MGAFGTYLEQAETQIHRDGFMTNAMRRNLARLKMICGDAKIARRIDQLVRRFYVQA
jgi:hypothetical protein